MIDRRLFLLSVAAVTACQPQQRIAPSSSSKRMAITMDDFAQSFDIGLSLEDRNENILDAFDAVGHKAAGFVTGSMVDSAWGKTCLQTWKARGHMIENHTWSHPHANEMSSEAYLADIAENYHFLSDEGHGKTYFRFPFLDDGKIRLQQEQLYAGLEGLRLISAPVTLDTVDWYTTSRLEARLRENPKADLSPYRAYYVAMCLKLANHWDSVAKAIGFTNLPHLTLMHHNILNGLFLKDVLVALRADGWSFVDAREALAFKPYHDLPPQRTNGRSWLTLKSQEAGLDVQPFPEEYLNFGRKTMDVLGL